MMAGTLLAQNITYEVAVKYDYYTRFINLNTSDGLSNNKVLDIVQDNYGFIWIATANGLNRYDGYRFKTFYHNPNDTNSISDNYITSLAIDTYNTLWIGTKNGLNYFDQKNEGFKRFPTNATVNKGISTTYVRKVYAAKNAALWVETGDGVLNKINLISFKTDQFRHQKISSTYYDYHSIIQDSAGNIWLGGRDMGPYKFDTLTHKFDLIMAERGNPTKKRDNDIACIFQDKKMRYWMSATDGFYQYFPQKQTFKKWHNTSTYDIINAPDNELWLGTAAGLFRFNAENQEFTIYKSNANDLHSLSNNHIYCLYNDTMGNLWIGTRQGISILNKNNNYFKHYRHIPENKNSLTSNKVSSFLQDHQNNIWIGTMGGGLNQWDKESQAFKQIKSPNYSHSAKDRISCMYEDHENNIFIGLWSGKGFYKFNPDNLSFKRFSLDSTSLKRDWYNAFYEDNKKRLWVGFWGASGIHFFNRDKEQFEPYFLLNYSNLHDAPIKTMELINGNLWINAIPGNIHRFNLKTKKYTNYSNIDSTAVFPEWKSDINQINGATPYFRKVNDFFVLHKNLCVSSDSGVFQWTKNKFIRHKLFQYPILDIAKTPGKDQYWLSTQQGFYKLVNNRPKIVASAIDTHSPIFNKKITEIIVFNDSLLLLGSPDGLITYNHHNKVFSSLPELKKECPELNQSIAHIAVSPQNQAWITTESGIVVLSPPLSVAKKYIKQTASTKGLSTNFINHIHFHKTLPIAWLATNKGLIKFNYKADQFKQVDRLKNIPVSVIKSSHPDTLWLGTGQGLISYLPGTGAINFFNQFGDHRLSSRLTKFIFEDASGHLWIGTTNKGINHINTKTWHVKQYMDQPQNPGGYWGESATCIHQMHNGQIWIGGEGINIFDTTKKEFSHLTTVNGLPSNQILNIKQDKYNGIWVTTPKGILNKKAGSQKWTVYDSKWGITTDVLNDAMYELKDGTILIGSQYGFFSFDPNNFYQHVKKMPVQITSFAVFGKEKGFDFTQNNTLQINYDENFFTIEFSDLSFSKEPPNFIYQLKGVDENWVNANKNTDASYTKISPGEYTFMVKPQEYPDTLAATLNIHIKPPFWQTWWFIALEIMLVASVILFFYQQRIKQFKMRENHLKLEQKLLRSQMNPHFVFNALIAIQSFIFKNNPTEAGRYLSKFAKLMRLFLQNTREEFIPLSQELETLTYYLELQKLRYNNQFSHTIKCTNEIDPETLAIPPMMAQPFIENSIEHGFRDIKYKGLIEVSYLLKKTGIIIEIKDNGKGIVQSRLEKINKRHKSLALNIIQERLSSFSKYKNQYKLEMYDLYQETEKENGTFIRINIPYKKLY